MVNTKVRLITFFAAKDGEAVYSQQNQDQELTVAQIMNSLLPKHYCYLIMFLKLGHRQILLKDTLLRYSD